MIRLKGRSRLVAGVAAVMIFAGVPYVVAGANTSTPKKDSCGYPDTTTTLAKTVFNEPTIMRGASVLGTGLSGQIAGFANESSALLLGVNGATAFPNRTISPYYSHIVNPSLGDATKQDVSHRALAPTLFITNITSNATSRAGDWQQKSTNGVAHVNDIFGSWATGTVSGSGSFSGVRPTHANNWNGVPDITTAQKTAFGNAGYGAELRWNLNDPVLHDETGAPLTGGNSYRYQIILHDGDQNMTGGDAGELCGTFSSPGVPTIQTKPNGQTPTNIQTAIGTPVNDTAVFTGSAGTVNGTVTFNLYFQPNPQPANACATPGATPPGTKVFTETDPLVGGQATSSNYNTSAQSALGVYYWQDVYNPAAGSHYTTITEGCGHETATVVDAHILLSPHSATNPVNAPHTLTTTVESTTDGSTFTPVPGVTVDFTLTGGSATFTGDSSCGPTDVNGQCQVTINSTDAGTTTINATATNFTIPNIIGSFTESTGSPGNDPDATKEYLNAICPGDTISTTSTDGSATSGQVTAAFTYVPGSPCKTYTEFDASSTDESSTTGKSITFLSQQLAGAHLTAHFDWGFFSYCRADAVVDPDVPPCPATSVDFGDGNGFHDATYCAAVTDPAIPWCVTSRTVSYETIPDGEGTVLVAHIVEDWDGVGDVVFKHR